MEYILLLTKNVLAESKLEEQLKVLGYEVFCTAMSLEVILNGIDVNIFSIFSKIIFSSTMSDNEVKLVLQNKYLDIGLYRVEEISESYEDEELHLEEWRAIGLTDILIAPCSNKSLRETLANTSTLFKYSRTNFESIREYQNPLNLVNLFAGLSQTQRRVIDVLIDLNGEFIQRKELAIKVWGSNSTSNLAQLSQIVTQIRNKIDRNNNAGGSYLITNWGKGYAISKDFLRTYVTEAYEHT